MVIGIFGESCVGKSTVAEQLKTALDAELYTGKDYLRLAKTEAAARKLFCQKLLDAGEGHIIYVLSEPELLDLLPQEALRVLVTAELDVIKERFAARMRGVLPPPVAAMLERKHGCFDNCAHDIHIMSGVTGPEEACQQILTAVGQR